MIEEFSESKNLARVTAGFKGGPFNRDPVPTPARTIENGWPATVSEKLHFTPTPQPKPLDPWVYRRPNAKGY